jgi:PAS domain S-box-containing protein
MEEARHALMPDAQIFRDIFNASPIGIAVENLEGQPLFVNRAFCSMLGFTEEELRTKHCVDFSPPEDAEKDWALFQQLRAGSIDHYQLDKRYFRRDGSLVWGSLSISLLKSSPSPLVLAMVQDITDKKKAEETRFRYAAVVESSDDAIASGTLDGIIVSWNTGAQKIYGYTEAEAVGKPISMLVPPELPDEESKILETLKAGGRIEHFETVRVSKTGKRINVSLSISPIKDSRGRTVGVSGIARDITERKRAEEALRLSEERLRLAQQAARIGTFERDVRTGRITWAEGLEPLYGLSPGSLDGKTPEFVKDLIHPNDRQRVAQLIRQALKTGQPTEGEWRAIWPDGSVHWIVSRWRVLMDDSGEPLRVVGVNLDITERKRAEEAIKESEQRFRLVADAAPVMIWMAGLDKRPTYFNRPWLDFTGRSETDLQNGLAALVHPEDYAKCHEIYCRGFDQRQPFRKECRLRRHDGQYRWMLDIGVPRFHQDGSFAGYIGSCIDITEQKLAEETLSSISRKLIEAQEQERTWIAREMHDDINQRLSVAAMELDRQGQNLQASADELRWSMAEVYKQISELSSDIHSMSHRLHSLKLDSLGLAAAGKSFCCELAERHDVEVRFSSERVPRKLPEAISLCLFRVLQEALQNAVKHSGVRHFRVSLVGSTSQIALIVCDEGRGFRPEEVGPRGGLGLTSMKERLNLVGGKFEIDAKPSRGTIIRAFVPLKAKAEFAGADI